MSLTSAPTSTWGRGFGGFRGGGFGGESFGGFRGDSFGSARMGGFEGGGFRSSEFSGARYRRLQALRRSQLRGLRKLISRRGRRFLRPHFRRLSRRLDQRTGRIRHAWGPRGAAAGRSGEVTTTVARRRQLRRRQPLRRGTAGRICGRGLSLGRGDGPARRGRRSVALGRRRGVRFPTDAGLR